MANTVRFTPERIADLRSKAEASYAWFHVNVFGNELPTAFHYKLCNQLQGIDPEMGPWTRLCVAGSRSVMLKTTIGVGYLFWRGLTDPSWSCHLTERKVDNAIRHLDQKLVQRIRNRYVRSMLEALWPERIPSGDFWTTKKLWLAGTAPDTPSLIECHGMDSALEGTHTRFIMCEDLEGADADDSEIPNRAAKRFVLTRAVSLLEDPERDQVCVVGTPHGPEPTVYELRNLEGEGADEGTLDNSKRRVWKIAWQPVVDSENKPIWPERVSEQWLADQWALADRDPDIRRWLLSQYFLLPPGAGMSDFEPETIDACNYEVHSGLVARYPATEFHIHPTTGQLHSRKLMKSCPFRECRFFVHVDPKHRGDSVSRRCEWAIVVVAVTPDFHRLVVDCWLSEEGVDEALKMIFRMYRRYVPYRWTLETTGAQIYLDTLVKELEKTKYYPMTSIGSQWNHNIRPIPKPSLKMIEANSLEDKEGRIFSRLAPLFQYQWLHLNPRHPGQVKLREHILRVGTESKDPIDGADALAQGAGTYAHPATKKQTPIWTPPPSRAAERAMKLQRALMRVSKTGKFPRDLLQSHTQQSPPVGVM